MKSLFKKAILISIFFFGSWIFESYSAGLEIPQKPELKVLDHAHIFTPKYYQALQRIVAEHERLQGEKIFIATFNGITSEVIQEYSKRIFGHWIDSQKEKSDSVLMVFSTDQKAAYIEAGINVEFALNQTKRDQIIRDYYLPEAQLKKVDRAVGLTLIQVLEALESPIVSEGEAQKMLRIGGMKGDWEPARLEAQRGWGWAIFVGILFVALMTFKVLSIEAHYSGEGWMRLPPWRFRLTVGKKSSQGIISGGGVSGGW